MENPFVLIEKLLQFDKEIISLTLLEFLKTGKIDFIELSNAYTQYLKCKEEDTELRLIEAETCILETFHLKHTTDKTLRKGLDHSNTQRCLYLLNQSRRFNMSTLNEKYGYDEEVGKKASYYELAKGTD